MLGGTMKHPLSKKLAELNTKLANTPVNLKAGKYSYESSLVMQLCAVDSIAEEMFELLAQDVERMGFGDVHDQTVTVLQKFIQFKKQKLDYIKNGGDFGEPERETIKKKRATPKEITHIFGYPAKEFMDRQQTKR
jgi:hypothetical protein